MRTGVKLPNDTEEALRGLLLLARSGDNAAYAAFLSRASGHLRAYFRRRLSAFPDDVEDLVQETLLALHNQRHTYRASEPLTAWLHAIARYKWVDLLRTRAPRAAAAVALDEAPDEAMADDSVAAAAEARRDLFRLLDGLPDRHRLPIVCVKIEGISVAEAAQRLRMSESAVKIGIHRGLRALAARARAGR